MHPHSDTRCTVVLSLLCLILFNCAKASEKGPNRGDTCGPLALKTCLMLLGHAVEASVCADLAGTDVAGSTTMAGLAKASRQLGRKVLGVRLAPRELATLNRPAILHTSYPDAKEHFCVFACYRDGRFELINPTMSPAREILSEKQLGLIWDGTCIVFAQRPLLDRITVVLLRFGKYLVLLSGLALGGSVAAISTKSRNIGKIALISAPLLIVVGVGVAVGFGDMWPATSKESLVLGMDVLDVGDVSVGAPVVRDTWLANVGRDAIKIDDSKTKGSCACLRVTTSDKDLAPGGKSILKLRMAPKRQLGRFAHKAYVATHDRQRPQTLIVRGNAVGPGVTFPPRLYFGRVYPGETINRTFAYIPRYADCEVLHVEGSSGAVKCIVLEKERRVVRIGVFVKAPDGGRFTGSIRLAVKDLEDTEIEVPFEGVVVQRL